METLLRDVRDGFRALRNNPGFTTIAILTLAIGIGANTALFSVVNGVLLNPLPYKNSDQLVSLYTKTTQFDNGSTSYPNFLDWQKSNHSFVALSAYRGDDFNLTGSGEAERLHGHMISADFFPVLGEAALLGRNFLPEEDVVGGRPVVILGDGLWKRRFGSSPDVLGKVLTLDGTPRTVIGVMPSAVTGLSSSDIYYPMGQWNEGAFRDRRVGMGMQVLGRLRPGVTQQQAQAELDGIAHNLAAAYPEQDTGKSIIQIPLKQDVVGDIGHFLFILLGAVGFVLLIACANVANLLLARATGRTREFAIRAALGASRTRLLRQLLTESVLLGVTGGALGLALAQWGTQAVLAALPSALPRAEEIHLDLRVLLFTFGVSVLAGVLFGLAPALRAAVPALSGTLKEGGRGIAAGHHRTQTAFVIGETALALILLIGAALMIRSLHALWNLDPGFDSRGVLTFSVAMSPQRSTDAPLVRESIREMLERFGEVGGVQSPAIIAGSLPMAGDSELPFWVEGQPKPASDDEMNWAIFYAVTSGYWDTMKIPLVRGRRLTEQDNEHSAPVIAIDETLARQLFGNDDPIGKRLNIGLFETQPTIVGVVRHIEHWGLGAKGHQKLQGQIYLPFMQFPDRFAPLVAHSESVVARTNGAPQSYAAAIRAASAKFDGNQVVYDFEAMDDIVSRSVATQRFVMLLLGGFAAIALLLAGIGIYGVLSYLVGQRTQEMGIRMALGARPWDVLRLVLGQGTRMAAIGIGIGLVCALALTRLMASMLFGVSAMDPLSFGGVAVLLMMIAALACYVPARRATRVDPWVALRYE